jgi:hypothetical protein
MDKIDNVESRIADIFGGKRRASKKGSKRRGGATGLTGGATGGRRRRASKKGSKRRGGATGGKKRGSKKMKRELNPKLAKYQELSKLVREHSTDKSISPVAKAAKKAFEEAKSKFPSKEMMDQVDEAKKLFKENPKKYL